MQHGPEIAQPGRRLAAQMMGIHACDLGRHVGAHAKQTPGELIGELEGLEIQILPGAGQERIQIIDEGRNDQLIAPARVEIQQFAAQTLDDPRLGRQDFLDAGGEQPAFLVHG